jgi:hypothetical protein
LIHFVEPRSRRIIVRVACRGKLNLPWLLCSVVPRGSRSGLTTGSYAYGMLTRLSAYVNGRGSRPGSVQEQVLLMRATAVRSSPDG